MGYNLTAEQQDELKKLKAKKEKNDITAMEKERLEKLLVIEKKMREATEKAEVIEVEKGAEAYEKSVERGESLDDFKKEHPEYFSGMR